MDYRKFSEELREIANKHLAGAVKVAEKLHAVADEMDPPRAVAAPKPRSLTCDVCGDQTTTLTTGDGRPCLSVRYKEHGPSCASLGPCPGTYRLDPGPDDELTTRDGTPLGVTRAALAYQQAVRDFLHGDDEAFGEMHELAEMPGIVDEAIDWRNGLLMKGVDIASTFGGRL